MMFTSSSPNRISNKYHNDLVEDFRKHQTEEQVLRARLESLQRRRAETLQLKNASGEKSQNFDERILLPSALSIGQNLANISREMVANHNLDANRARVIIRNALDNISDNLANAAHYDVRLHRAFTQATELSTRQRVIPEPGRGVSKEVLLKKKAAAIRGDVQGWYEDDWVHSALQSANGSRVNTPSPNATLKYGTFASPAKQPSRPTSSGAPLSDFEKAQREKAARVERMKEAKGAANDISRATAEDYKEKAMTMSVVSSGPVPAGTMLPNTQDLSYIGPGMEAHGLLGTGMGVTNNPSAKVGVKHPTYWWTKDEVSPAWLDTLRDKKKMKRKLYRGKPKYYANFDSRVHGGGGQVLDQDEYFFDMMDEADDRVQDRRDIVDEMFPMDPYVQGPYTYSTQAMTNWVQRKNADPWRPAPGQGRRKKGTARSKTIPVHPREYENAKPIVVLPEGFDPYQGRDKDEERARNLADKIMTKELFVQSKPKTMPQSNAYGLPPPAFESDEEEVDQDADRNDTRSWANRSNMAGSMTSTAFRRPRRDPQELSQVAEPTLHQGEDGVMGARPSSVAGGVRTSVGWVVAGVKEDLTGMDDRLPLVGKEDEMAAAYSFDAQSYKEASIKSGKKPNKLLSPFYNGGGEDDGGSLQSARSPASPPHHNPGGWFDQQQTSAQNSARMTTTPSTMRQTTVMGQPGGDLAGRQMPAQSQHWAQGGSQRKTTTFNFEN